MIAETFDSAFFITISTLFFGSIALCLRIGLKSKCETVNYSCCWDCFSLKVHRNVLLEEHLERLVGISSSQKLNGDELV
jgi:hypothetical protein